MCFSKTLGLLPNQRVIDESEGLKEKKGFDIYLWYDGGCGMWTNSLFQVVWVIAQSPVARWLQSKVSLKAQTDWVLSIDGGLLKSLMSLDGQRLKIHSGVF